MPSNKPSVVILNPARSYGSEKERKLADHLAVAFSKAGWSVDWHLDANDALVRRSSGRLIRDLTPVPMAEGWVRFVEEVAPAETPAGRRDAAHRRGGVGRRAEPARSAVQQTSSMITPVAQRAIAERDRWARNTWHDPNAGVASRGAALLTWAAIRAYYKVQYAGAATGWRMRGAWRASVDALYWKALYPYGVEPTVTASKTIRWKFLHPVSQVINHAAKDVYWRVLYPYGVEPASNLSSKAYWRVLHPVFDRSKRRRLAAAARREAQAATSADLLPAAPVKTAEKPIAIGQPHIDPRHEVFSAFAKHLSGLIDSKQQPDLVVLLGAEAVHFEALLAMVPGLGLDAPLDIPLIVQLSGSDRIAGAASFVNKATLARRLGSGNPFARTIVLDSIEPSQASSWNGLHLVRTRPAENDDDLPLSLATSIFERAEDICGGRSDVSSLVVREFGPLAILSSALWGRVGSTTIFDTQMRVLINGGYRVARFYFDHWPHFGEDRLPRIAKMVVEDQQQIRPHYEVVFERNEGGAHVAKLLASSEFQQGSPVLRMSMLMASPTTTDAATAAFLGRNASVAIVNHLPQLRATQALTSAKIIFETHDVFSHLLDIHGIPDFVPKGPDGADLRLSEEAAGWKSAELCVNLTDDDQHVISQHTPASELVSPTKARSYPTNRSWSEVAVANLLPPEKASVGYFDLMLWGSWHDNNVQSIRWFLDVVRPLLGKHRDARIVVAGKVVKGLGKAVGQYPDVVFCDFVDVLEDFASRTRVLVIPDQEGTGICVKTMDALAWSACFAATKSGMRGTRLGSLDYRPSETARQLANDIIKLLDSLTAREQRRVVADALFELNYSEEAYDRHWAQILHRVAPAANRQAVSIVTDTLAQLVDHSAARPSLVEKRVRRPAVVTHGKPMLSVVVATYKRYDVLPDAIESLRRQSLPGSHIEIIVVDNSPDQGKAAAIGKRYQGIPGLIYHLEPIPGLSNARNVGTAIASADIVSFVDDDAIVDPDWASEIAAAFEKFPKAGIVGGRIIPRWVTPKPAWLPEKLLSHLSIVDWGGEARMLESDKWVAGCNISFRKDMLKAVGGFSRALGRIGPEAALLSNEETAVSEKIHALGFGTAYAPQAKVDHVIDPARLERKWFRRRAAWQAVSDFIKAPGAVEAQIAGAIDHVRWAARHRKVGLPLGFYNFGDDVEAFQQDAAIIYDYVKVLLSGGILVQREHANSPSSDLSASVVAQSAATRQTSPKSAAKSVWARKSKLTLSVVVATYNRYDTLPDCISALLDQDIDAKAFEIVVVDNSPDQATAAKFAKNYTREKRVKYVLEPQPGLSNARNVGIEQSTGDIVAFIDDDAIADKGWAAQLLTAFEAAGEEAGCVGGRILPRWVSPKPAWLPDTLLGYLSIIDWGGSLRPLNASEWLAGCNIAFRREVLTKAGGFTPALGRIGAGASLLSNEDNDMIERVKKLGTSINYAPAALVHHIIDPARLTRQWFLRRSAWQAASDFIGSSRETTKYAAVATTRLFGEVSRGQDALGFFEETDDPSEFGRQVGMIYDMVVMSLTGGEEIGPDGRLMTETTVPDAIANKVKATLRGLLPPGSPLRRAVTAIRRA